LSCHFIRLIVVVVVVVPVVHFFHPLTCRWDETPVSSRSMQTPFGGHGTMETPTPGQLAPMTPETVFAQRWQQEIDWKNRDLTDEELVCGKLVIVSIDVCI
jgi:hypothetical protein